jgi:hypothetical protein
MGITRVAPKLTKIETRLGRDGSIESERIIHADGHVEYPGQKVQQETEIELLKRDIEIEKLKKELEQLKGSK